MAERAARIALYAGALLAAISVAAGLVAAARHDEARASWRRASRLEGEAYDAARSDALYAGVLEHRAQAERAGWVAALGVVLALAGAGARPRSVPMGRSAPLAASLALAIDAVLVAATLAALDGAGRALGVDHAGHAALLGRIGGALVAAGWWAALARGRSAGGLVLRVRFARNERSPGLARAALALLLAPLALAAMPLSLAVGALRRSHRAPLALRWAGLSAALDGARGSE